ncbi:ExbD/TolR family protein [Aquabacterium sp.]|uniref:ExbD/TolR family protein n=1 Tax=Aquabacterium sp. TaxID=1872578 RepID=UPI0037848933
MSFGRLESPGASRPMSDINMTPLIDVMLVLLVIFMITAPLMTSSLKLDLPKTEGAKPTDAALFITVAVNPQGQLFWGDEAVNAEQLKLRVREAAVRNKATEVQLRADKSVPYGRIAELIGLVQEGGLVRIGFVTESSAAPAR